MAQVIVSNSYVGNNPDIPVKVTLSGGANVQHVNIDSGSVTTEVPTYTIRIDEQATYTYFGYAVPGTAEAAATWQIRRVTNASGNLLFADGSDDFDQVWNDRASLTYS